MKKVVFTSLIVLALAVLVLGNLAAGQSPLPTPIPPLTKTPAKGTPSLPVTLVKPTGTLEAKPTETPEMSSPEIPTLTPEPTPTPTPQVEKTTPTPTATATARPGRIKPQETPTPVMVLPESGGVIYCVRVYVKGR